MRCREAVVSIAGAAGPAGRTFDWTVTGGTTTCIIGRGFPVSGVMVYDASTRRRVHGLAPFDQRGDFFYMIGTKP